MALAPFLAMARPNVVFGSDPVVGAFIGKIRGPRVLKQKFPFANFIPKVRVELIS